MKKSGVTGVDLGGTPLAIFSLPLEEIYQDHTYMPRLYMHLSLIHVTGKYVLACVPHAVCVSVHIRRICAQTVFKLFVHILYTSSEARLWRASLLRRSFDSGPSTALRRL